jgi:hypothetical protein
MLHLDDECNCKKQVYCFDPDADGGSCLGENANGANFVTMACALHRSDWHFDLISVSNSLLSMSFFGLKTRSEAGSGCSC